MEGNHPKRGSSEIAEDGGLGRRRGLPRPVPRPEPLLAAPRVGLAGTAERAGAFLSFEITTAAATSARGSPTSPRAATSRHPLHSPLGLVWTATANGRYKQVRGRIRHRHAMDG